MLTKKQIEFFAPAAKKVPYPDGNGLYLLVEPSGIKRFVGKTRFPSGRKGKQIDVPIGVFGAISLKDARELWTERKLWSKQHGHDPRKFGIDLSIDPDNAKTLRDAIDGFLETKKQQKLKEHTLHNYNLQLNHQVCSVIPESTRLRDLEWGRGGRERVMALKSQIEARGSYDQANRVQKVLAQALNFAEVQGWMAVGSNPARKHPGEINKHKPQHHPSIQWDEVPELLDAININRCSGHIQAVLALKFMLLTFLRAGALSRLRWKWIDKTQKMLTIPGDTPGLKRVAGKSDHLDHHVPLTDEMNQILEHAWKLNGQTPYVFGAIQEGTDYPHLNPEAPNNLLKNLGYASKLRAHGWRQLPLTVGQEILKTDHEIIQRQMGHLIGDKIRQAYDRSLMLEERRQFLQKWSLLLVEQGLKF